MSIRGRERISNKRQKQTKTKKYNSRKTARELRRDLPKVIQLVQAEKSTRYNSLRRIRTKHRSFSSDAAQAKGTTDTDH